MDLRKRVKRDYAALHNSGQHLHQNIHVCNKVKRKWSTSQLFDVTIIEERTSPAGTHEVKVHYIGWGPEYDE